MEGASVVVDEGDQELLSLPPGFRFHPTDEEIITHYLYKKVVNHKFSATAMGEVDLNRCEPWDLPKKAKMGEKGLYFFCQRDRKYPTGMRTNRATESGYWKATGKDKEIYSKGKGRQLVGMKKTLVFYKGRAPKGEKSNWVMHEFRLDGKFSYHNFPMSAKDEWVVCKVFHKNTGLVLKRSNTMTELLRMNSFVEGLLDSPSNMPPLIDSPYNSNVVMNNEGDLKGTIITNATTSAKSSAHANAFSYFPTNQTQMQPQQQQQQQHYMTSFNPTNYQITTPMMTNNNYQIPSSIFYSHNGNNNIPNANAHFPNYQQRNNNISISSFSGSPYIEHESLTRQLKVEEMSSNQSVVSWSQDKGLSNDLTVEISSNQVNAGKQAYGDISPLSDDPDSFWINY